MPPDAAGGGASGIHRPSSAPGRSGSSGGTSGGAGRRGRASSGRRGRASLHAHSAVESRTQSTRATLRSRRAASTGAATATAGNHEQVRRAGFPDGATAAASTTGRAPSPAGSGPTSASSAKSCAGRGCGLGTPTSTTGASAAANLNRQYEQGGVVVDKGTRNHSARAARTARGGITATASAAGATQGEGDGRVRGNTQCVGARSSESCWCACAEFHRVDLATGRGRQRREDRLDPGDRNKGSTDQHRPTHHGTP
jgi:hypothetical protein